MPANDRIRATRNLDRRPPSPPRSARSAPAMPWLGEVWSHARPRPPVGGRASEGVGRSRSTPRLASDATNGFGLTGDVGEKSLVRRPLQALFDQGPEDNLQANGKLHGHRRPAGQPPRAMDEGGGQDDEHARLVREHPGTSHCIYIIYDSYELFDRPSRSSGTVDD